MIIYRTTVDVAKVEKLFAVLLLQVESVRTALEFYAPGTNEIFVRIEDNHGVCTFAASMNGVVNVN